MFCFCLARNYLTCVGQIETHMVYLPVVYVPVNAERTYGRKNKRRKILKRREA